MSPPNLPPPAYFVPLGLLIDYVKGGHKFQPVTVDDIRSGAQGGKGMRLASMHVGVCVAGELPCQLGWLSAARQPSAGVHASPAPNLFSR